jgi:hypothetical protein
MYNDGKGAVWISEAKAIKNPYYGSQMLTCGSVKKEFKMKKVLKIILAIVLFIFIAIHFISLPLMIKGRFTNRFYPI